MRVPSFIMGSYESQSAAADGERTMNFYVEGMEAPGAKNRAALYPTPGQQAWATVAEIGTRALFTMNSRTHGVFGGQVRELFATQTTTARGTVLQDPNLAQITYNGAVGNQLLIASGGTTYYEDLSTNIVTATGVAASQVGAIDGQGLALDRTTATVRISALEDFSTWDPTLFLQRNTAPDPWQALITADRTGSREVWLIGEQTGDVYYPTGSATNPYAPIPGSLFKHGTAAPASVAATGQEIIWLSQSAEGAGIVVAATGYVPQRISTHAVETAIAGYQRTSIITDAEAFTYQDQGHSFYVLRFPAANATWVCDRVTGLWHERGTWNAAQNRYDAWHPRVHAYAFGLHLVGEVGTGQISTMDVTCGHEADGAVIRRQRIAPAIFREHRQFLTRRLELYLETGLGASWPLPAPINTAPTGQPALVATPLTVSPGAVVTVTVANGPGNVADWVGLFHASDSDGAPVVSYQYLNGLITHPTTGSTSATLTFTLPLTPGDYTWRFFVNDTLTRLAISNTVTVAIGFVPGTDATVMLRYSDDGGRTWSNERHASAGALGQYRTRVLWLRLGLSRDRVYEFTFSDPIPWRIVDAFINNDAGVRAA